ncbi:transposable element tc1 [Fusarium langsethiae]|uniref:Transposable element tc1 n=1 Tax=Fusarium langsethiae TaxID=179993 RepID=A0A0N0DFJ2_FUSLA|nr:transposable element tc1 [Fusarium langsethiae]GKU04534.1 unnamed protein product [Fusarium langsethiae]GKU17851.1 unnamed protein product [Fusarium langsethiae]
MDEHQAWAMSYNKKLNSQQLRSSQQCDQIAALQCMTYDHHEDPADLQLLRNISQVEQLLEAFALPANTQVAAEAASRHGLRAKARAQARVEAHQAHLQARRKITQSSSSPNTLTLSIRPKVPTLTNDQIRQLVEFVQSNPNARRTPMAEIPSALGFDCSERTITLALGRKGFKCSPAITRPRIDEETRQLRLNFARERLHWTAEQWESVLFYAEMRVPLTKQSQEVFVIRKSDEDIHPDCINFEPVAPTDDTNSNVYFAYLSGVAGTGRLRSWTRHNNSKHGPLCAQNWYCHIFDSLDNFVDDHSVGSRFALSPDLPAYCSATIKDALRGGHMPALHMPPASPDLNLITEIFGTMTANLKAEKANSLYGGVAEYRIDDVVRSTWEGISKEYLTELIESMPERCQAVIDADGWYTRF